MKILFATSEAYPLIKTGGLADVSGSLPRALLALQHDVRLLLPAYRDALAKARPIGVKTVAQFDVDGTAVGILETRLPGTRVKTWLVDCPAFFDRPGNPYHDANNQVYPDNDQRFLLFSRVAAMLAMNHGDLDWQPDVLHCNDWQTGLAPAYLSTETKRPATIFTIHNLAYQGVFPYETFVATQLPPSYWSFEALEFHGQLSFIKGGIVFADRINTVSPTYAREIQTEEFGYGLDPLLRYRSAVLSGILNGIDTQEWNPGTDIHLPQRYNRQKIALKTRNKLALQQQMQLPQDENIPLLGFVGRLVEQKGIDWILASIPLLVEQNVQLTLIGTGEQHYEIALKHAAAQYPNNIAVTIDYSESLAHRIEAGVDLFLMPSRFEPCGLNQLYSLRYGTLPLVNRVGGLADSVIDADSDDANANGFVFDAPTATALQQCVIRALDTYREQKQWRQLQLNGMSQDYSWTHSAQLYVQLYENALVG